MSREDEFLQFAEQIGDLSELFTDQYRPVAEDLCSRAADRQEVEYELGMMLEDCRYEGVRELFYRICDRYESVYPDLIAFERKYCSEMFEPEDEAPGEDVPADDDIPVHPDRRYTQAVMIDMQPRLLTAMLDAERVVGSCALLLKGLKVLGVPVTVTQQYTRGLGDTDERLMDAWSGSVVYDKITYSCWEDEAIRDRIESDPARNTVLVFGAETHICVLQTAEDLLAAGYDVHIVCDCVTSGKAYDMEIALRRLESEGAVLTTAETCLFELLGRAGTPEFKEISALVKEYRAQH